MTVTEALYIVTQMYSVGSSSFSHLLLLYILPPSTFLNAFKNDVCNFRKQKRLVSPAGFEEIFFFQGCAFYLCCGFLFFFLYYKL